MAYEYVVDGKKISLPVNPDKIAVRFKEPAPQPMRAAVVDPKPELGAFDDRVEVPEESFTIVDVTPSAQPGPQRFAEAEAVLEEDAEVVRTSPVFDVGDTQVIATDRLLVGFQEPVSADEAQTRLEEKLGAGVEVLEELAPETGEFKVLLPETMDPFVAAQSLTESEAVEYAEPDFVTLGAHTALRQTATPPGPGVTAASAAPAPAGPTDPLLPLQYAMKNIQADQAWALTTGDRNIRIAILDEGVDALHPDLSGSIVGQFDGLSNTSLQQPNPWDGHGTACAGLAAAIHNTIGVRGVAGGCSILAVRIAKSNAPGAAWTTSNAQIQSAIDWAWRNGADVLSNSWGGGSPSNAIIRAFRRARVLGRAGKGCVVVVAAGNSAGPVIFPGTLPEILTVSASNEDDEPKTRTSSDGETWWGSCLGPEVDVAAPGVHNYTTDNSGAAGYDTSDYFPKFNGTSSATPLVAGAAGLVLSVAPHLKEIDVRELLKQTADKVGTVVYTNGHNDQMGHGRINVLKAIQQAMPPAAS